MTIQLLRAALRPLMIATFLATTAPSDAAAQTPPAPESATASNEVLGNVFTLELFPTEITQGEPVHLRLKVVNARGHLIVGNFSVRLYLSEGNDLEVRVAAPGQLPQRYVGVESGGLFAGTETSLDRDQESITDTVLLYEASSPTGLLFDTPGDYTVSVRLSGSVYRERQQTIVTLPPTRIKVLAAKTDKQRAAFSMLSDKDFAKALHMGISSDQSTLQRARDFVRAHGDHPMMPFALTLLANEQMYSQKPNYQAAAGLYLDLAKRFPASPKAPGAWFTAAQAYHRMGDVETARSIYWLLRDLYPGFPFLRPEVPLSNEMEFGPKDFLASRPWFHYASPFSQQTPPDKETPRP